MNLLYSLTLAYLAIRTSTGGLGMPVVRWYFGDLRWLLQQVEKGLLVALIVVAVWQVM